MNFLTVLVACVALLWASVQGADAASIPFGSYQQSCQNIRASSGVLKANCQTRCGDFILTRLENYSACRGDIANDDGELICGDVDDYPPPPPPGKRQPPEGSYLKSCRNLDVERGTLSAECQDMTGAWKQTSIGLRGCRGAPDIANVNGTPTCEAPLREPQAR